jgi:DNA polymerase-4
MTAFCRDCDTRLRETDPHCPRCQSTRIISHPDLNTLMIAHIDCDAFFAALEKRDDPSLRDRPVIVGGGQRGVVATCCYIARLHGVRSAMPMFKALKACPEAVVIRPRRAVYATASRQVRTLLHALTPLVEMVSIDEAYLDLRGTERLHGAAPAVSLSRLARKIEAAVGITISIGLSDTKFLAKTASELDKPRCFAALSREEAPAFLAPKPVRFLHGVGQQLARRLEQDNIHTVGDIQSHTPRELISRYGETGLWLHQRASGLDDRPVQPDSDRKSVSSERTFPTDLSRLDDLEDQLWQTCDQVAGRAKELGLAGATVTMKLKTHRFRTLTRSVSLPAPVQLANALFRVTKPLLARETRSGAAYRLIGVSLSNLIQAGDDLPDLLDPGIAKRARAERASDAARKKFGKDAVLTGRAMRTIRSKPSTDPDSA